MFDKEKYTKVIQEAEKLSGITLTDQEKETWLKTLEIADSKGWLNEVGDCEYVGMPINDALAKAKRQGYIPRIDSKYGGCDANPKRINFNVKYGKVTSWCIG